MLEVRDAVAGEWPALVAMVARALCHEPYFVGVLGDDRLVRVGGTGRLYGQMPWGGDRVVVAAFADEVPVGVAVAGPPRSCALCVRTANGGGRPDDPVLAKLHDFDLAVAAQHARQPGHNRVAPVAVEPVAQHARVGTAVMDALVARLLAAGDDVVLLECLPPLERFYGAHGFRTVASFRDPNGPDVLLMRTDLA